MFYVWPAWMTHYKVAQSLSLWLECGRIPSKPSSTRGLCNSWTVTMCQKKNPITQSGGCVRCNKLASKLSYRAVHHFVLTLPSLNQLLNEQCARTLPSVQAIFHRLIVFFLYICPDGSSFFLFFFADVSNACHSKN